MTERLTNQGYTVKDVIRMSHTYYKTKSGDDKKKRARLDVINAIITARNNYDYDAETKTWEQTGRDVKIEFIVRSDPVSYKKIDKIKIHKYPITILLHNVERGINSTFQWRTGSLKKPVFSKPGMTPKEVAEKNIRNGVQLQFVTELMFVLKKNNLLFGRCWATRPPIKTNPKNKIFMDKHMYFICQNFLVRMLQEDGGIIKKTLIKHNKI